MKRIALLLLAASLTACGYRTDEYALNHSAPPPGAAVVAGPVKDINPVSGQLIGAGIGAGYGLPMRSRANSRFDRTEPLRIKRY